MPSSHLAGRFAPAEELPGGYYRQANDSGALHSNMMRRDPESALSVAGSRRDHSTDSFLSSASSVYTPRRVESIFDPGDTIAYLAQQALQRPPGGAMFEADRQTQRYAPPVSLENRRHGLRRRSSSAGPSRGRSIPLVIETDRHPGLPRRRRSVSIDSLRSVSTVSMHFHIPAHLQPQGTEPRGRRAASPPQRRSSAPPAPVLDVPRASSRRPQSHNGRSPLARKSFVRLATDGAASISGADVERESRRSRRMSSDDERGPQRRGRRRTPTAYGSDGRRRLSKRSRAPESREPSQG